MSRLLVDDITKTDRRACFNVNKAALISDIVAPSKEYIVCSGAQQLTIVAGCVISIAGTGVFETEQTILTAANLDTGSSFTVGKDYYVYVCDSGNKDADEVYKISLNSTYPAGWTALNSRKIGGFHYGKVRGVDAATGKPVNASGIVKGSGWQNNIYNGIVPRSVWTLGHRPKCAPEGMVYLGGGIWVDIYLNSNDGKGGLQSKYGATPMTGSEGLNWYDFAHRLQKSGKRLPSLQEFTQYAYGSPGGLDSSNDYAWTATTNSGRTTTGNVARAVSAVGVRDAVGNVWEWLDEIVTRAAHATSATYHAKEVWDWDITTPLLTGEDADISSGNIYQYYAFSIAPLIAGGHWERGITAGTRAVSCGNYPWHVDTPVGARGVCDSL